MVIPFLWTEAKAGFARKLVCFTKDKIFGSQGYSTPCWASTGQPGGKLDAGEPAACDGTYFNRGDARGPG